LNQTSSSIEVGSVWERKRTTGHGHEFMFVTVTKVTVNNVEFREKSGRKLTKVINQFLGTFQPYEAADGKLPWCIRCGQFRVRELGHTLCEYCVKDTYWRTAHSRLKAGPEQQNGPVRSYQPPLLGVVQNTVSVTIDIPDHDPEESSMPKADPAPASSASTPTWRVEIRRVVVTTDTVEIVAKDPMSVQAEIEAQYPGAEIDDMHRLRPNGRAKEAA
jgi:hypothetical protein